MLCQCTVVSVSCPQALQITRGLFATRLSNVVIHWLKLSSVGSIGMIHHISITTVQWLYGLAQERFLYDLTKNIKPVLASAKSSVVIYEMRKKDVLC